MACIARELNQEKEPWNLAVRDIEDRAALRRPKEHGEFESVPTATTCHHRPRLGTATVEPAIGHLKTIINRAPSRAGSRPLAVEQLRKLDALWALRGVLAEISRETYRSVEAAAEQLLDALDTLVMNSTDLHPTYEDDVRKKVLIATGMCKRSPESAAKSLRQTCKAMLRHLEEDFSR